MFLFSRAHSSHTGVSLIETLVAIALFSIVAVAMLAAFTTLIAENRKSRTQKIVLDNVQATLDSMTREIRNGSGVVISGGGTRIQFEPSAGDGDEATTNDQIVYTTTGGQVMRSLNGGASWQAMTAPEMNIDKLFFQQVNGIPGVQTSILMTLVGNAGTDKKTSSAFTLQTTVVARGSIKVDNPTNICAAQVVSGYISRLLFDEASSGSVPVTALDTAHTSSAILNNGITWTAGKWCNAVNFDGVDDYINYPAPRRHDFDNLYQSGGLTISAWIRPTSANPAADNGHDMSGLCSAWVDTTPGHSSEQITCPSLCIANTDGNATPDGWAFFINPNLSLGFHADNGTVRAPWKLSEAGVILLNEWQHVAVTWDGQNLTNTNGIKLYINGDQETPYAYEPHVDNRFGFGDDSQNSMTLGACTEWVFDGGAPGNIFFKGAIDDFRIYRGVLTGGQIKELALNSIHSIEVEDF